MIIGAGPAGLTAGIYSSRSKVNSLILEDAIVGGQVKNSYTIENYPGFKKISGAELADLMQEQAEALGANIDEFDIIEKVKFTNMIVQGLHSFLMCELVPFALNVNLYSCRNLICYLSLTAYTVYLGEFIIPKGATYCLNSNGEVVSDSLMYTGNHIKITSDKIYNSKELWKEK